MSSLMDVEMPGMDGIAATALIRHTQPSVQVLMVTTFGRPGFLRRALAAGASGFVVKDTRPVSWPMRCVGWPPGCGSSTLPRGGQPRRRRLPIDRPGDRRPARGPVRGTVAEIARSVHLTEGTVRNHLSAAIGKTGARNRADATRIAEEHGWL